MEIKEFIKRCLKAMESFETSWNGKEYTATIDEMVAWVFPNHPTERDMAKAMIRLCWNELQAWDKAFDNCGY